MPISQALSNAASALAQAQSQIPATDVDTVAALNAAYASISSAAAKYQELGQ